MIDRRVAFDLCELRGLCVAEFPATTFNEVMLAQAHQLTSGGRDGRLDFLGRPAFDRA